MNIHSEAPLLRQTSTEKREFNQSQGSNTNTPNKRPKQDDASKNKSEYVMKKGWLDLDLRTKIIFPDVMKETPGKNFATLGKFFRFPKYRSKNGGFLSD